MNDEQWEIFFQELNEMETEDLEAINDEIDCILGRRDEE